TVKLGGSVPTNSIASGNRGYDTFGGGANTLGGKWSWASINGIITVDARKLNSIVKHYNQALLYNSTWVTLSDPEPTTVPTTNDNIYASADGKTVWKWKKYTSGIEAHFEILLWSGASVKQAKLEITPATADTDYTVTVDWSGVTFN
ncbi:MAG: hypothetical protein LBD65_02035, partial [Spirochaetaceae bacterium]|nr:hypothetical protein [Spirochaetaceae bacterium]